MIAATARLAAAVAFTMAAAAAATLDPRLPAYDPQPATPPKDAGYLLPDGTVHIVSGNRGIGVALEGFNALFARTHPGAKFRIDYNREGNSVNIAALAHGITLVGPLGRETNWLEQTSYRNIVGGEPLTIKIAHGTPVAAGRRSGVYVNRTIRSGSSRWTSARIFTTGAPVAILRTEQLGTSSEWASAHP
jgi:phosphate transport system substrate-binding protein